MIKQILSIKIIFIYCSSSKVYATFISPENVKIPESIDWRSKGAITPVKDQGHCGSCWAFASTGALEAHNFRKTGKLISISEQNLVDCCDISGCNGCKGGIMDSAFKYIKDNGGIDSEDTYQYVAADDKCRYNPENNVGTDLGSVRIEAKNEEELKKAVATVGPVSVAIDCPNSFFGYHGGIFNEPSCSSDHLTHGVLVVGYGTEEGHDYWLVKNSWGEGWGEKGYIKMSRNTNNQCGIATHAVYPIV